MSEAEHTPGPWRFDPTNQGQHMVFNPSGRHMESANIYWAIGHSGQDAPGIYVNCTLNHRLSASLTDCDAECVANARLIAAAPDLLDALRATIDGRVRQSHNAVHSSRRFCDACGVNSYEVVHAPNCPILKAEKAIARAEGGE